MKEGRSKVVFKRLIRHKGFLKIHLAELQMSCKFLSSIWPSGSFCLTTRRSLILIFFVALNSHLCSQLKTTFCCFKTLFNWVILVFGGGLETEILIRLMFYKFWGWGWQFAMRDSYYKHCSEFHMTNKEALEFDLHV